MNENELELDRSGSRMNWNLVQRLRAKERISQITVEQALQKVIKL